MGLVEPLSAASLSLFGGVVAVLVEGAEKRRVKGLFGRYVSKDVFKQLLDDPAMAELGERRREMTVLFSDIRGFTAASEKGTPEAVVLQLNEYFNEMVEVLFRHHGTLDKFVGDMVMGLFGAPVEDPRHADHAVAAAREMTAVLGRLNARWRGEGRPTMDIGIGINSGEMIAGNIGASTIMSYTVIGDAVNLGSSRVAQQEMRHAYPDQPGHEGPAHDLDRDAPDRRGESEGTRQERGDLRGEELMTKTMLVAALLLATPVTEQFPQLDKLRKAADKVADMHFTDSEERQLGPTSAHSCARNTGSCRTETSTSTSRWSDRCWRRRAAGRHCSGPSSCSTQTA